MNEGFILSKLILKGDGLPDASLDFQAGVNYVHGPSDTGKSFILSCFDYMFGSQSLNEIPEFQGYNIVYLEIISGKKYYVLKREIGNLKYVCKYDCGISDLSDNQNCEKLLIKNDPEKTNTLSYFYLNLINLSNKKLRKNKGGDLHELGIRYISKLILIDETRITTTESPVFTGQIIQETAYKSLFKLILTGVDDSSLEKKISDKNLIKKQSKLDVINTFIKKLGYESVYWTEDELKVKKKKLEEVKSDIDGLNSTFKSGKKDFNAYIKGKLVFSDIKNQLTQEIDSLKLNKANTINLKNQYISDILRLEATIESGSQMIYSEHNQAECILCNRLLDEKCEEKNILLVVESCREEMDKIEFLKGDLIKSELALKEKIEILKKKNSKNDESIKNLNEKYNSEITKDITSLGVTLKSKYNEKSELIRNIDDNKKLSFLLNEKTDIEEYLEEHTIKTISSESIGNEALQAFYDVFESILVQVKFLNKTEFTIEMDTDIFDVVIDGRKRGSYGKGFRSILYSIFLISLFLVGKKNGLQVQTLILDSPILNYKEAKGIKEEDKKKINNIGKNLLKYLIKQKEIKQYIIIENKEPSKELDDTMHIIYFTGMKDIGRFGFIPVKN